MQIKAKSPCQSLKSLTIINENRNIKKHKHSVIQNIVSSKSWGAKGMGGKRHGGQKTGGQKAGGQKAGGQKAWGAKGRGAKGRGAKDRGAKDRGAKDRGAKVLSPYKPTPFVKRDYVFLAHGTHKEYLGILWHH